MYVEPAVIIEIQTSYFDTVNWKLRYWIIGGPELESCRTTDQEGLIATMKKQKLNRLNYYLCRYFYR